MGVDITALNAFLEALKYVVKKERCLTLGRQEIHISPDMMDILCDHYGYYGYSTLFHPDPKGGYMERLIKYVRFSTAGDSIDANLYEHANIIKNLNDIFTHPVQYDLIFDGGTTEHIFNIVNVFQNIFNLLKEGGIFVSITPHNNQPGHGFYQFSPNFYMDLFQPETSGMEIINLWVAKVGDTIEDWVDVLSTEKGFRQNFNFGDSDPTYNVVIARKVSNVEFTIPIQGSYRDREWAMTGPKI